MCGKKITHLEIFLIYAATQDTPTPPPPISAGNTGGEGAYCSDVAPIPFHLFYMCGKKKRTELGIRESRKSPVLEPYWLRTKNST